MCLRTIDSELALVQDIIGMQSRNRSSNSYNNTMQDRTIRRRVSTNGSYAGDIKRSQQWHHHHRKPEYFTAEWACAVALLTASLLLLPLLLPPLPPPPFLLLIVPVVIMILLIFLAFMPSDGRNMTSPYL